MENPTPDARQEQPYLRDGVTWVAFFALSAFGLLNAVLGPAFPYLGAEEGLSYLVGALHRWRSRSAAVWPAARGAPPRLRRSAAVVAIGLSGAGFAGLLSATAPGAR